MQACILAYWRGFSAKKNKLPLKKGLTNGYSIVKKYAGLERCKAATGSGIARSQFRGGAARSGAMLRRVHVRGHGNHWRKIEMAIKKAKKGDKALTKTKIIEVLAEESCLAKKDVKGLLEKLTELAYAQAAVGFTLPGVGKLMVVQRKRRKGRNPATGETIMIPAKTVVK